MRWIGLSLALLAACSHDLPLDDEIRVVRSDVRVLENEVAPESPLWMPEFNQILEDNTPTIPETVYRHVIRKLYKMSDAEIAGQVKTGVKVRELKDDPTHYRGQFLRIVGRVSRVWIEEVNFSGYPRRVVIAGILYVNDFEPVLFHILNKPDVLEVKQDMIGFEGVFLKVVSFDLTNGGQLRAPLLVAQGLRKYH